jgi:hypothetical protein
LNFTEMDLLLPAQSSPRTRFGLNGTLRPYLRNVASPCISCPFVV